MPDSKDDAHEEMVDLLQAHAWGCPRCNTLNCILVHVVDPDDPDHASPEEDARIQALRDLAGPVAPELDFLRIHIPTTVTCDGCGREFPVRPDEDDGGDETGVYPPVPRAPEA